jgi:hypothetical protein
MSILDQYKKAIEEEEENMNFPTDSELTDKDKDAYETVLRKMRNGDYSADEVNEAISNSRKNMANLGEKHSGGVNEQAIKVNMERITDDALLKDNLLKEGSISDIKVIRAYCPKCGKELVSKAPSMYNPFTMEKVCIHECCGTKYNLDRSYPHIAFYDEDENEINSFF